MKNSLLAGSLALFALCASAKDPVAMTVNGKDVKLSEFEYLYNKNKINYNLFTIKILVF